MLRMSRAIFAITALAVVASVAVANAQQRSSGYYSYSKPGPELGVFGGYYIASDLYNVTSAGIGGAGSQIGLANSFMWGARLGMSASRNFSYELVYTRTGSNVSINKTLNGYNPQSVGRLNGNSGDLDFLFRQPSLGNPQVTGFFELGFGWTWTDPSGITSPVSPSQKAIKPETLFNWNFALGGIYDINPKFALRLDARWRITDTHVSTSTGTWCDYYGYCYAYSSSLYNTGELTAGLTYKLGK